MTAPTRAAMVAVAALFWAGLLVLVAISTAHGKRDTSQGPREPQKGKASLPKPTTEIQDLGVCESNPWKAELVLGGEGQRYSTCPRPSPPTPEGPWTPWTHRPVCVGSGDGTYCVYTDVTFRGGRGLSVIAAPHIGAAVAATLDDSRVPPRLRDHPSTNLAGDPAQEHGAVAQGNAFQVQPIAGRGKGVVATRRIKAGELVFVDYPVILSQNSFNLQAPMPGGTPAPIMELLQIAVRQLTAGQQARIHALAHSRGGERVRDILQTNVFGIEPDGESLIGLFPLGSRANHNCQPNTYWRYTQGYQSQEVIALRDIESGEEVSHSYIPLGMVYAERQKTISGWGFNCTCPLCSASPQQRAVSDQRRRRLHSIHAELSKRGDSSSTGYSPSDRAILLEETVDELLFLVEKEQIWPVLCYYYIVVARAYLDIADYASARRFWHRAHTAFATYGGEQHGNLDEIAQLWKQITEQERLSGASRV